MNGDPSIADDDPEAVDEDPLVADDIMHIVELAKHEVDSCSNAASSHCCDWRIGNSGRHSERRAECSWFKVQTD